MNTETIKAIAPPLITFLAAIVAGIIALCAIQAQKATARRRAAIDLFLKTEMDRAMLDAHGSYQEGVKRLEHWDGIATFKEREGAHYKAIRGYLNIHELIAVGIKQKVFDEEVCFHFWCVQLIDACRDCEALIQHIRRQEGEAGTYKHLCDLYDCWEPRAIAEYGLSVAPPRSGQDAPQHRRMVS
jgi:hypothetical protein